MCEFCGCGMGRPHKRPIEERDTGKNIAAIRILGVGPKEPEPQRPGSRRTVRDASEDKVEERSASRGG